MKIINKTKWDTIALRKLFSLCVKWLVKCGEGKINKGLVIEVVYGRYSGLGSYYRKWMRVRVPTPVRSMWVKKEGVLPQGETRWNLEQQVVRLDVLGVAEIFCHEYCHNLGYRHGSGLSHRSTDEFYLDDMAKCYGFKWEDYEISRRIERVKPKVDLQLKRHQHVLEIIEKKTRQLKRLQNQIRRWMQKKRYYEKILVAAGKVKR